MCLSIRLYAGNEIDVFDNKKSTYNIYIFFTLSALTFENQKPSTPRVHVVHEYVYMYIYIILCTR